MELNQPESKVWAESSTDAELIRAVGRQHDSAAFTSLYQRYEKPAYALARHLLWRADLAEEAVQEAMLCLWRSAARFRHEKNPRGWVLQIVAHECIRIQRRQGRAAAAGGRVAGPSPELGDPVCQADQAELQAGLRRALGQVPNLDRQLIALHYLGGLTQGQIATELGIPQQTVSLRLTGALKELRRELAKAGFAVALPLPLGSVLAEALVLSYPCPASLLAGVQAVLAREGLGPLGGTERWTPSHPPRLGAAFSILSLTLLAALATAAGVYWLWAGREGPEQAAGTADAVPSADPLSSGGAAQPDRGGPRLFKRWSFEEGLPEGFQVVHGSWDRVKRAGPWSGLAPFPAKERAVTTVLPVEVPPCPCEVALELVISAPDLKSKRVNQDEIKVFGGFTVGWYHEDPAKRESAWYLKALHANMDFGRPQVYRSSFYLIDRYIVRIGYGVVREMRVNRVPYPTRRVFITAFGYWVRSLELRTLHRREIPAILHDPKALAERIRPQAVAGLEGWVVASDLPPE